MISLTLQQFIDAAKALGIETATEQACAQVEGGGLGFYGNGHNAGKIILKFEGHVFHLFTKGIYDQSHPTLSYKEWTEIYDTDNPYDRFDQAFTLDPHAAMLSTSWGAFQIMGENYSSCGFKTVDAFITFLKLDLDNHLVAFDNYLKSANLVRFLVAKDWAGYAYRYNGPLYQKNDYAGQLQRAYLKFKTPN
ncbi:N-acetylmuramidase family protein [Mucilaginibacter sp.]